MTFQEIKTLVRGYINRTDLTEDFLEASINMGVQKVQRTLRLPFMESINSYTLNTESPTLAVPTDYLEMKNVWINGTPIERKSADYVTSMKDETGIPQYFARVGNEFIFAPRPSEEVTLDTLSYTKAATLVEPEDTNGFLDRGSDMILWSTLAFLGEFYEDSRTDKWKAYAGEVIAELDAQAEDEAYSGSPVAINITQEY